MAAPGSALANLAAALAEHQALVRRGSGFVKGQSFPAQQQGALQRALQGIGGSGGVHFGPGGNDPGFGRPEPRPTGGAGLSPPVQAQPANPGSFGGGVPHQHPVLHGPVGSPTGGAGLSPGGVNPGGPMQRQPRPFPVPRPRPLPRGGGGFYPR